MQSAIDQFRANMARIRNLHTIYDNLSESNTTGLDLSDMLRNELAMAVSALDSYIHEIIRLGMLEAYRGLRPRTKKFEEYKTNLNLLYESSVTPATVEWLESQIVNQPDLQKFPDIAKVLRAIAENELRQQSDALINKIKISLDQISYQNPETIKDGINLIKEFGKRGLWVEVADLVNGNDKDIKNRLKAIVERRNKIVHEADVEYPFGILREVRRDEILADTDFIEKIVEAIHTLL